MLVLTNNCDALRSFFFAFVKLKNQLFVIRFYLLLLRKGVGRAWQGWGRGSSY